MINHPLPEDQVNTILALSKSPPSGAQIRRLAYAFDWRKAWLPWQPNSHGTLEMARVESGKKHRWPELSMNPSGQRWKVFAVSESWWTHSQLLQLSRLCRKSSWQDAMECRMPRKNRIFDKKKWQAWSSCSSSRYIQLHFLNFPLVTNGTWHTKGIHSPALYLASTLVKTLFGATIKQKDLFFWYTYLLIHIYIYTHTRFFSNICNDSWNSQM